MDRSRQHTLSRKERLKSRTTIERLFAEGKSIFVFPLKLIFLPVGRHQNGPPTYLFGVTVPKRIHKSASKRNLLKRRIREAFRQNKPGPIIKNGSVQDYALMYILVDKEVSDYDTISDAVKKLHRRFLKINTQSANSE